MDKFEALKTFVLVSECGGFSAAAHRENVDKSVISRRIDALETELGVRLVSRTTRKMSLTDAGQDYLEKSKKILSLLSEADDAVHGASSIPKGRIRLSVPVSFGISNLSSYLASFMREYPEILLDVDYDDRMVNLIEDGFDMAIRISSSTPHGSSVSTLLSKSRLIACAAPSYLEEHGTPALPHDLSQHDLLLYSRGPSTLIMGNPMGSAEIRIDPHLKANNGEALCHFARDGHGITIQPDFIVSPYLSDGSLVRILEDFDMPTLGIYVVLPSFGKIPMRVRRLRDYLIAVFRSELK